MADDFDPYYKWLGIPPEEQPPHHYRLLGVRPFESDPDVIANAVDQRMTHLRTFQSGKNASHSQKLLNEVSAAKLCLFNAAQKAEYDRQLRGRLAKAASVPPTSMPGPIGTIGMSPMPHPGYAAPGMPLAGMNPQARHPMPMQQPVQGGAPRQGPINQPAANQAAPAASSDFDEIGGISSRRRSKSRRPTNSLAFPAIAIAVLLSALVGIVVFFKSGGGNELLAKHDASPGKAKVKVAKDKGPKSAGDKPADDGGDDYSPPEGAVQALVKRAATLVAAKHFKPTESVGGPGGIAFWEPKGLLVGFQFGLSPLDDGDTLAINSVLGLYDTGGTRPSPGRSHGGDVKTNRKIVLAKPGFAVGWLELAPGDRVTGARVHFCGITKNGLSTSKTYDSGWIGPEGDEPAKKLGTGRPIVGLAGNSSTLVNRLGLILATSGNEAAATAESGSDEPADEPMPQTAMTPEKTPATGATPPGGAMPGGGVMPSAEMERRVLANLSGGSEQPLAPIPDSEAIRAALAKIRESFKAPYAEISAASPKPLIANTKRWDLALKLYMAAKDETDAVVRYVLLEEARRMTVLTGDLKAVLMTIAEMASRYQIDEVPVTIDSLTEAFKVTATASEKATPATDRREVGEKALSLIGKAVERERFAEADRLIELARKMSGGDGLFKQQINWRKARLVEQRQAFDDAQPALETLQKDPADADANLVAGRYRCLFQEAWKDGLPLLAKGSDGTLKKLAEQELNPPGEPDAQAKLGDEWSAAAESNKPLSAYFKMRARQWYETAWPRITGIVSKQSVQGKLDEMLGGHGLTAEYFAGAGKFDNKVLSRVDPLIDFKWSKSPPEELPAQFTVRWTGWLVPPNKGGQFTIVLEHNVGARLWLDSKLLIDESSAAGHGETKSYKLQAKSPRHIKVEYFSDGGKKAQVSLRWSQQGEFPEQPVPPEALFQEKTEAEKVYSPLPVHRPGSNAPLYVMPTEPVPTVLLPNGPVPNMPIPNVPLPKTK